ncbi:AraC family transcriptional regulator [Hymenobacter sp. RP-2-7]|uniref:AraC family transcriptional regulator n=1 Tax=Hymenobacter polaris TaxID=2682546 RepID=A0A7Y0AF00_9BACT|nr:helix-turn-helix domain-containing protein [Hymenobacter polaris]NML66128.1 AraC family transcriptional regulator [Hymenobacter polaris]
MFVRYYSPAPPLRPYVRHYMVVHIRATGGQPLPAPKPQPPGPVQSLYFYPRDAMRTTHYGQGRDIGVGRSILVGPQVSRVDLHFAPDHLVVRVACQPGGLHRLLGVPVRELYDFALDSRAVLGPALDEVADRLAETTDYQQMVTVVEAYLLHAARRLAAPTRPLDQLLPQLLSGWVARPVEQLAHEVCLSPRQFERQFVERVGMGPKLYARVARFDQAFRLKEACPALDWLAVALHCGYYDYRHLVRDFREFAGATPPQLLAAEAAHNYLVGKA